MARSPLRAGAAVLVAAGLAGYVTAVYAIVVIGGAALAHQSGRPPVALSVAATTLVALGFEPVGRRLRPIATRFVGDRRASPYDLLTGLHPDVVAVDEAPARMARLLAEATGARSAQVLLTVGGRPEPVAAWPPGGMPGGDRLSLPVRQNGVTLGELVIDVDQPLTPVEERLFRDLAGQAGLVLRAVALRAELAERLRDSTRRAAELRASRERVVAAQDEERRRLERDIHDGAQQHLVALAVQLRLARTLVARSSDRASGAVAGLRTAAEDAFATLASLAQGIYPRHLADGVGPALAAILSPTGDRIDGRTVVDLDVEEAGRMSPEAERALYFCALEAVQNASKHAKASRITVRARRLGSAVELVVSDDGIGFAREPPAPGQGLTYALGLVPVELVRAAGVFMMAVAAVAAAAALVLRLRRSTGPRQRQLRWIMFSAVLLAAGLVVFVAAAFSVGAPPAYLVYPLYVGFAAVPICTGIAILRYRLYDIDVIISRAVVLAVLTAFVTIGYVVVVVVAGTLGARFERRLWPSLVVLVVVALAFQPLRWRVVRLADRLVYGRRAAPYEALADFTARLGRSLDPQALLPAMAKAVAGVVGAAYVRVSADAPDLSATWPDTVERAPDVEVEVRDGSAVLGRIAVVMPRGVRLRPSERHLLGDVAAQAVLALRNVRLEAELRSQVEHVAGQAAMLEASRRRLLAARDEERRRTAAVIDREVVRHLRPIPDAVTGLDPADREAAEEALRRSEEGADRALEALREVTRGVYPTLLTRWGVAEAVRGHAGRTGRSDALTVEEDVEGARFGDRVESAAYFCAVAMLADTDALRISIAGGRLILQARLERDPDETVLDRVGAADGTLSRSVDPAGATIVRIELPAQRRAASAQTDANRSVPKEDLAT